jgi:hypothetical protein
LRDNKLKPTGVEVSMEGTMWKLMSILFHDDDKFMAKVARKLPPPEPFVTAIQQSTRDKMAMMMINLLKSANEVPLVLMKPPKDLMIVQDIQYAPQSKMQSHVRGLGLVASAFGPRHAPAACLALLSQWLKRDFWLERPQADVLTCMHIAPSSSAREGRYKGGPWLEDTLGNAGGKRRLRNALRNAPIVPPQNPSRSRMLLLHINLMLPRELAANCAEHVAKADATGAKRRASAREIQEMERVGHLYRTLARRVQASADALPDAIEYFRMIALEIVTK